MTGQLIEKIETIATGKSARNVVSELSEPPPSVRQPKSLSAVPRKIPVSMMLSGIKPVSSRSTIRLRWLRVLVVVYSHTSYNLDECVDNALVTANYGSTSVPVRSLRTWRMINIRLATGWG